MIEELKPNTVIFMGTFNGASYLHAQLDSLIAQTVSSWMLYVRDDGSSDETPDILAQYATKDHRIRLITEDTFKGGSALNNFAGLINLAYESKADYLFSCDQDDVWEPTKLAQLLQELKLIEGADKSASLVHHDLAVVDEKLNLINESFIDMMSIRPGNEQNPQRLISRNEVTGCAMACNRALLELALPISKDAVMHDWWLALFAGFFGRLHFMPQTLVKYRQHDKNVIGAKSFWHGLNPFTNWVKGWRRGNAEFLDTVKQAKAFQRAIAGRAINMGADEILNLYIGLPSASRIQRLKNLRVCNLWRSHWFLNAMLILRLLLLPRSPA